MQMNRQNKHRREKARRSIIARAYVTPAIPPRKWSGGYHPVHFKRQGNKKTDAANHLLVIDRVGLLFNEPPGGAGLLFS